MLDFTSALYLGLAHPSAGLGPWRALTTGRPAALGAAPEAREIAEQVAQLVGTERATLSRSTLHAFFDLFGLLSTRALVVCVDAGAYPIGRWGAERATARGMPVVQFSHHDPDALRWTLGRFRFGRGQAVVLTDGYHAGCSTVAPLPQYAGAVRERGGLLVVDDTQAFGILGQRRGDAAPYGKAGGGTIAWTGMDPSDVLVVSSLAKGLGAPVTTVSGSAGWIASFKAWTGTRWHASPPTRADLRAAVRALAVNRARGEDLRSALVMRVERFRRGVRGLGLPMTRSLFPLQSLGPAPGFDPEQAHVTLRAAGVGAILHKPTCRGRVELAFAITNLHRLEDIDRAIEALRTTANVSVAQDRPGSPVP